MFWILAAAYGVTGCLYTIYRGPELIRFLIAEKEDGADWDEIWWLCWTMQLASTFAWPFVIWRTYVEGKDNG